MVFTAVQRCTVFFAAFGDDGFLSHPVCNNEYVGGNEVSGSRTDMIRRNFSLRRMSWKLGMRRMVYDDGISGKLSGG